MIFSKCLERYPYTYTYTCTYTHTYQWRGSPGSCLQEEILKFRYMPKAGQLKGRWGEFCYFGGKWS